MIVDAVLGLKVWRPIDVGYYQGRVAVGLLGDSPPFSHCLLKQSVVLWLTVKAGISILVSQ